MPPSSVTVVGIDLSESMLAAARERVSREGVKGRVRVRTGSARRIPFPRAARMLISVAMLVPMGLALGMPMPTGLRLLGAKAPQMVPWAWGINGALSVLGATLAIFIAMNWGFRITLLTASAVYVVAATALLVATEQ